MGSWNLNTTDFNPANDTGMGVEFSEDMEEEKKNPPQSTVPNQEVETVVTQTESNVSKAENPNLNLIGLEQPNKPDLFGRRETEDDDLIGLVNPDSIDRPIQTSGGIFGTKRDKDR